MSHEAKEVQEGAAKLQAQIAEFTVTLQDLEDDLLAKLAASRGDILEDTALVTSLEHAKATAAEVAAKVDHAKVYYLGFSPPSIHSIVFYDAYSIYFSSKCVDYR